MFWIYVLSSLKFVPTLWLIILCFDSQTTNKFLIVSLIISIVVFDVIDGRIASWLGSNNAKRRLFDNFSDVIITHVSYISIIFFIRWSWVWYIPLLLRDSILVLMGIRAIKKSIVIFPGIFHKFARLVLPVSAIFMVYGIQGEIILTTGLSIFFLALVDYFGFFIFFSKKEITTNDNSLKEMHINSFKGLAFLASNQKLLPPIERKTAL